MVVASLRTLLALSLLLVLVCGSSSEKQHPVSEGTTNERDRRVRCQGRERDPRYECRVFDVPLDWDNPQAGTRQVHYTRYAAAPDVGRKGTLFIDMSDPFMTYPTRFDVAFHFSKRASNDTGGKYDVITWDPRGRGYDSPRNPVIPPPVKCFDDEEEKLDFYVDLNDDLEIEPAWDDRLVFLREPGPEDAQHWLTLQSAMLQHCAYKQNTTMLRYMGTASTVRDLVAMADAFDGPDSPINLWGSWYGARIGRYLLQMFPERAGRIVIEAMSEHLLSNSPHGYDLWKGDVENLQTVLAAYVKACSHGKHQDCSLDRSNSMIRDAPFHYLQVALMTARLLLSGWQISPEVDMNNTALVSAFEAFEPLVSFGVTAKPTDVIETINGFLSFINDSADVQAVSILCGDQLADYDPDTHSEFMRGLEPRLQQDIHMAPLLMSSVFPPLHYLCPLWPFRASERIDIDSAPPRPVAYPPLVIRYASDPLSRPMPIERIVPGIPEARSVTQLGYATHAIEPEGCLSHTIRDYLREGKLPPEHAVCEPDRRKPDPSANISDSTTTADVEPSAESPAEFGAESPEPIEFYSPEEGSMSWVPKVLGLVVVASVLSVIINMGLKRRKRGALKLEGHDLLG